MLMLWRTATSGFYGFGQTLPCLDIWIKLLAVRQDFVCWTDALNWRGTAGFLHQGLGEHTHTWASSIRGLTGLTKMKRTRCCCYESLREV
eukprot:1147861-Pelagomonas_calceolata.AAC.1